MIVLIFGELWRDAIASQLEMLHFVLLDINI